MLGARMALWNGRRSPLPPGARWVEYLESTGTQYIDTGVVWNRALTVSATIAGTLSTSYALQSFFGARDLNAANAGYSFGFNSSNKFVSDNSGSRATSSMGYVQGEVYTVVKNLSGCSITNAAGTTENLVNNAGTQTATYNLLLFALNNVGTAVITKSRFYACKIYDANNILVRDFRPIAIGTTGYMLDMVSGQYLPYGNAGTGDFVLGPELVQSITATADLANAAQVKTWIDGVCAERGLSSVYCTLAVSSHYANDSNFVVGFSVNSAGQPASIIRQRGSYTLDVLGPERFGPAYDTVVKAGDKFAITSPTQISITNPALTITANTTTSNAAQVKTWLEAACAAKGITGACLTLVRPADFTENTNRVFVASVDASGVAVNACRQRISGALNNIAQVNLTNAYDAVVKAGDVFAVFPSTGGAS